YTKTQLGSLFGRREFDAPRKAIILVFNPIRPWMSVAHWWFCHFNSREYFYDHSSYDTPHTLQNF
ncbi:hypothetical protein H5410_000142, partial [Solanum commersonii]